MARIDVFKSETFVKTGHNIISRSFSLPYTTKCTAIIDAFSDGDTYARKFEVYIDGNLARTTTVAHQLNEQVNIGYLNSGVHELGIKLTTFVGYWTVHASVEADTIDAPTITPPEITEGPAQVVPSSEILSPEILVPPSTGVPEPAVEPPVEASVWNWLTIEPLQKMLFQAEIDARNIGLIRDRTVPQTPTLVAPDLKVIPTPTWLESSSLPLSVQAMNDRLKDLPTSWLPNLEFNYDKPKAEYGPTEMGNLVGIFSSHKDNFGREVFSIGDSFSLEPQMLLLGAGLAALAAAVLFKRKEITSYVKKVVT